MVRVRRQLRTIRHCLAKERQRDRRGSSGDLARPRRGQPASRRLLAVHFELMRHVAEEAEQFAAPLGGDERHREGVVERVPVRGQRFGGESGHILVEGLDDGLEVPIGLGAEFVELRPVARTCGDSLSMRSVM